MPISARRADRPRRLSSRPTRRTSSRPPRLAARESARGVVEHGAKVVHLARRRLELALAGAGAAEVERAPRSPRARIPAPLETPPCRASSRQAPDAGAPRQPPRGPHRGFVEPRFQPARRSLILVMHALNRSIARQVLSPASARIHDRRERDRGRVIVPRCPVRSAARFRARNQLQILPRLFDRHHASSRGSPVTTSVGRVMRMARVDEIDASAPARIRAAMRDGEIRCGSTRTRCRAVNAGATRQVGSAARISGGRARAPSARTPAARGAARRGSASVARSSGTAAAAWTRGPARRRARDDAPRSSAPPSRRTRRRQSTARSTPARSMRPSHLREMRLRSRVIRRTRCPLSRSPQSESVITAEVPRQLVEAGPHPCQRLQCPDDPGNHDQRSAPWTKVLNHRHAALDHFSSSAAYLSSAYAAMRSSVSRSPHRPGTPRARGRAGTVR